jgi:hypothetical protein
LAESGSKEAAGAGKWGKTMKKREKGDVGTEKICGVWLNLRTNRACQGSLPQFINKSGVCIGLGL